MIGTEGPSGSVKYQADPTQPGGYSQVTTLSPTQQGLQDQQNSIYGQALGLGQKQLGNVDSALGQQLTAPSLQTQIGGDYNQTVKAAQDAAYNQATSRLDPQWSMDQSHLQTQLANQGLSQNSAAYQNAMDTFGRAKNDAYSSAENQAFTQGQAAQNQGFNQSAAQGTFGNTAAQQGFTNQATAQNQPINQLSALLGLGQVSSPTGISYSPTQVANTDVLGANALGYQTASNNYNQAQQQQASTLNGLFNLGSTAIMYSDRRLKLDIVKVGEAKGLNWYAYRYIWSPIRHIGVMAQEVLLVKPEAVHEVNGYLAVDYGAL